MGRLTFYDETFSEWFYGDARYAWSELNMIFDEFDFTVTDKYQCNENKIVRFGGLISKQSIRLDSNYSIGIMAK